MDIDGFCVQPRPCQFRRQLDGHLHDLPCGLELGLEDLCLILVFRNSTRKGRASRVGLRIKDVPMEPGWRIFTKHVAWPCRQLTPYSYWAIKRFYFIWPVSVDINACSVPSSARACFRFGKQYPPRAKYLVFSSVILFSRFLKEIKRIVGVPVRSKCCRTCRMSDEEVYFFLSLFYLFYLFYFILFYFILFYFLFFIFFSSSVLSPAVHANMEHIPDHTPIAYCRASCVCSEVPTLPSRSI